MLIFFLLILFIDPSALEKMPNPPNPKYKKKRNYASGFKNKVMKIGL